jgi:hypothetical protein
MARRDQCPARYLSLAAFEVTIIGRFWVTAEDLLSRLDFLLTGITPETIKT